jgi:hypothetical protein
MPQFMTLIQEKYGFLWFKFKISFDFIDSKALKNLNVDL